MTNLNVMDGIKELFELDSAHGNSMYKDISSSLKYITTS